MSNNPILYAIFGAVVAWAFVSSAGNGDKITVYYEYCSDFKHAALACPKRLNYMKIEYKVSYDNQIVISKSGDSAGNCVVYDKENWRCVRPDGELYMVDGDIWQAGSGKGLDENDTVSDMPMYSQISFIEYFIGEFRDFFSQLGL